MSSKVVYTKEQIVQLRESAQALAPSEALLSAVRTIEETSEPVPAKPVSRFERRQEKLKQSSAAAAASSAPATKSNAASLYDKFAKGSDRDRNAPPSSWRGGKDRETFEEGYLYELRESAKQRKTLESTIAEQDILLDKAAAVNKEQAQRTEKALAEIKSTKESEEDAQQDDDEGFFQELTQKPRTSRFFSGGGADEKDEPPVPVAAKARAIAVNPVDIELPSSTVVWNQNSANALKETTKTTVVSSSTNVQPSARPMQPNNSATQPRQQALPTAAPPNAKVISAADLESQLFSQKKPDRTTAVMGTFDAAQLEKQLLAKTQPKPQPPPQQAPQAQPAPAQLQPAPVQHQPLPMPQAPFQVQPSVRVQYPAQVQIQGARPVAAVPMHSQAPSAQWGVAQAQPPQVLAQPGMIQQQQQQQQYGYYAQGNFQQPHAAQPMMMYPQQQQPRVQQPAPQPQHQPFGYQGGMGFAPRQ